MGAGGSNAVGGRFGMIQAGRWPLDRTPAPHVPGLMPISPSASYALAGRRTGEPRAKKSPGQPGDSKSQGVRRCQRMVLIGSVPPQ